MKNKKNYTFHTVAENIDTSGALLNIRQLINQSENITFALHQNLPQLVGICHCGAIDHDSNTIVLFTNSNSSFYKINQLIPEIENAFFISNIRYDRIMVKIRPLVNQIKSSKPKKALTKQQQAGLLKIAQQIGREDLIREPSIEESINLEDDISIQL